MFTNEDKEVIAYLQEIWGYSKLEDIDDLTLDCIRENADEGYEFDVIIIETMIERGLI